MSVAVIVPRGGECRHREQAWAWVRGRYAAEHPDWELIEAPAPDGEWCKGAAVNPAIRTSDAEIIVQADADVWCDGLGQAVEAVKGGVGWAVPHMLVHRLTRDGTEAVLHGADWHSQSSEQRPYEGIAGGGIVVAPREALRDVPLDERFVGWGQDDEAHALALNALYEDPWRGSADLVHLWHPPQARLSRRKGSREGWALRRHYWEARQHPDKMRALIEEGRCPSAA